MSGPTTDAVPGPGRVVDLVRVLALSCHPGPTVLVTVLMTALAAVTGRGAGWTAAVALTVLVGQLSIGWSNDALDARRDRAVGRAGKPAAVGLVRPVVLARLAHVALLLAVGLSFVVAPWPGALCHVVLLAGAWAYNLGVKRTAWSLVPYVVGFGALPGLVLVGSARGFPWWAAATGALLGLAAGLANGARDVDDDLRTGVHGAVTRLGARRARRLAALSLVAAFAVLLIGTVP